MKMLGNLRNLKDNESFKRLSFKRLSFKRLSFKRLSFKRLSFKRLSFKRLSFKCLNFKRLSFKRLSFKRLSFKRLSFKRLSFKRLSFKRLSFKRLSFKCLNFKPLSFKRLSFKRLSFKRLSFKRLSFKCLNFKRLSFKRLSFKRLSFKRLSFKCLNFKRLSFKCLSFKRLSFKRLSVTDDYTMVERQLLKEYSLKAKEMNEKESPDTKYVWSVRGTPKKRAGREEVTEAEASDSTKLIDFDEAINHKNDISVNDSIVLMTTNNFSIDYSVRGIAKCKRCKNKMDMNVLKFGKNVLFKSRYTRQYFHVDCALDIFKKARVPTTAFGSLNELDGFA